MSRILCQLTILVPWDVAGNEPDIWFVHHSHIMVAMLLHVIDFISPIAFMYITLLVLSDCIRMWLAVEALRRNFRPNGTALISR